MLNKLSLSSFLVSSSLLAYALISQIGPSLFSHGTLASNMAAGLKEDSISLYTIILSFSIGTIALIKGRKNMYRYIAMFFLFFSVTIGSLPVFDVISVVIKEKRHEADAAILRDLSKDISGLLKYSSLLEYRYDSNWLGDVHVFLLLDTEKLPQISNKHQDQASGTENINKALSYDIDTINNFIWHVSNSKKWVNYYVFLEERLVYVGHSTEKGFPPDEHPSNRLQLYHDNNKVYLRFKLKEEWESIELQK